MRQPSSMADIALVSAEPRQAEEELLNEIAYYRARLADIDKAPPNSRHREGRERVSSRLYQALEHLSRLRDRRTR